MLLIRNEDTDPYLNLAKEEYLLKHTDKDYFMLWRNEPSVIIGKHQNALSEINIEFVQKNNIDVVRRLSGGGTVFHDLGNLNFTYIETVEKDKSLVNFRKYTKAIVDVLQNLGVDARFEGRNDIMINGRKISGNAEHVFKNRVLHHGTLLFSSQISNLSSALKVNPLKYNDNSVKSVRSRVTNIKDHLHEEIDVLEFRDYIFSYIQDTTSGTVFFDLSDKDIINIADLLKSKYKTWKWNFGYSPKYHFEKSFSYNNLSFDVRMEVENGFIVDFQSIIDNSDFTILKDLFIGIEHSPLAMMDALKNEKKLSIFDQVELDDFIYQFF